MKNKLFALLTCYSAFLPLYMLTGFILLPDEEIFLYLGLLAVMMALGFLFGWLCRGNAFYAGVIGAVLCIGAVLAVSAGGVYDSILDHLCNLTAGALAFVPFYQGQNAASKPWYDAVQPGMYVTFLFLYAVLTLFVRTLWPFGDLTRLFPGAVFYTAVYGLFAMNRLQLGAQLNRNRRYKNKLVEAEDKKNQNRTAAIPVSGSMRRHNLLMVTVTLLCALALAPAFSAGLSAAGEAIVAALNDRETTSAEATLPGTIEPEATVVNDKAGNDNPNVRNALNIISLAAFGLLAAGIIFVMAKKAREWAENIFKSARKPRKKRKKPEKMRQDDELYEEVVEEIDFKLFGGKKLGNIVRERIGWPAMRTEEEKVRYLYRQAVRKAAGKGYKRARSKTAFETLGEIAYADGNAAHEKAYRALADAYDTTRYDQSPPAAGTAAAIREKLK